MSDIEKSKTSTDNLLHQISGVMKNVFYSDSKKFIVLTRSRTGSNMLLSLLRSHPNIRAEGEILNRLKGRNFQDIISTAFSKQPFYVKAKGFKVFYYHPLDGDNDALMNYLTGIENLYVIHLMRKNIIRTLVSRKIAGIQDVWETSTNNSSGEPAAKKAVSFTIEEIDEDVNETKLWGQKAEKLFEKNKLINVFYEDLVADRDAEFKKITDFLEVRQTMPSTALKKQNPESLKNLIVNYDELAKNSANRDWQEFLIRG